MKSLKMLHTTLVCVDFVELDTAGIPNTTQFLTPVNGSRTSDEEGKVLLINVPHF